MSPAEQDAHLVLADVYRADWGRLLGGLIRRHGRPDLAEDALAEAFASASASWPADGVPANPPGWLAHVASRRVLDALRHESTARAKAPLLAVAEAVLADDDGFPRADLLRGVAGQPTSPAAGRLPGVDVDDRLPLLFMATHPALAPEVRPALALRFVLGVPTADIAALLLVPTATMAARLTRAKGRLRAIGVGFTMPDPQVWPERVDDVARAIYLAFTAGYAPREGEQVVRVAVAGEAVRLAALAAHLLPGQPVLDALTALLVLQHARRDARAGPDGDLVRLADQDRSTWHAGEIAVGLATLTRLTPGTGYAEELRLQALVAAFHDTAPTSGATDWAAIARTYARLEDLTGSPIVRLNRAVAVAEIAGPMAGLAVLQAAADQLPGHHRIAVVRAELLRRDGDREGARTAYGQAVATCPDGPERRHLLRRLAIL